MDFFPQRPPVSPKIYAYELIGVASHRGYIKVGYTERDVDTRIREQTHTVAVPYRVLETWPAMRSDGSCFTDKDLHAVLRRKGFWQLNEGEDRNEWFRCTVNDVKAAVYAVRNRTENVENRTNDFSMRPEQKEAVDKTEAYFRSAAAEGYPKFLWNCKMRFGKTFAAYQLAKRMGFKRVLVLTFKPAVVSAWQEDLNTHKDFEGWQFISRTTELTYETADQSRPIVCFGSFQDYLGVDKTPAPSRAAMSGYIPSTGIWSFSMNTTLAHGKRTPRSCLNRTMRTTTIPKIWSSTAVPMPTMKHGCPSPPTTTCICPAPPSVPSTPASSSRSRSTTGPIPMNNVPKKTGRESTIPTLLCPGWS